MTTTQSTVIRETCDTAVGAFWDANVPFDVGLVDAPPNWVNAVPTDVENFQYAIVTPLPSDGPYVRCLTGVENEVELRYNVLSVGADRRQATWVADQMRKVWSDREPVQGNFVNVLTITSHVVMDRGQAGEFGAPQLESGLYQVVDTYYVRVSRDG